MSRVVEGTHASDDVSTPEDAGNGMHKQAHMSQAQLIAMMSPNTRVSGACYSVTVSSCRMPHGICHADRMNSLCIYWGIRSVPPCMRPVQAARHTALDAGVDLQQFRL